MPLIAVALIVGLVLGRALPRRQPPRLRGAPIAASGVLMTGGSWAVSGGVGAALLVGGLIVLTLVATINHQVLGAPVLAAGLALNALVVAVNGAMPVQAASVHQAGLVDRGELATADLGSHRRVEQPGDHLTVLDDRIPIRPLSAVVSPGDIAIALGVALAVAALSRRQPSMSRASPLHDWGTAPRPVPSSGSQYSASPDATAPATVGPATSSAPPSHNR